MKPNRLLSTVNRIHQWVPSSLQSTALSWAFNSHIKYAGTTGIAIQQLNPQQSVVSLKNRTHVQNHLGGIHATAMATLAESATGMLFGLHVPDTHLPLLKRMTVRYHKRAVGDLLAVASLTNSQTMAIANDDKGSAVVAVRVTDEEGKEPIQCDMEWAWIRKPSSKQTKSKNTSEPRNTEETNKPGSSDEKKPMAA